MINRPVVLLISIIFGLLQPFTVLGSVRDLRYQAEIKPSNQDETLTSYYGVLELTDEVLGQARAATPDLRIYAGDEEIPYALLPSNLSDKDVRYQRVDMINLGQDTAGNLVFEVQIPAKQTFDELRLLTADTNFVRKVKVEGSHDQINWVLLQAGSTVFYLTNEQKPRNTSVRFAKTNFPFLRITVLGEVKSPLRLDGLELALTAPQENIGELKERPYDLHTSTLEGGIQEIVLDLYYSNLPTRELELVTGDVNFSRRVELYGSQTRDNWSLVTQGEIFSYRLDKALADQRSIRFNAAYRYLKLKVYNQNNRPLTLQEVKIRGLNPGVTFPTALAKKYILYWGNEQLPKPEYDLQKLMVNIDYAKLSRFNLEKTQANPLYVLTDTRPWTERNAWLLNIVLFIVVLVLAVFIAKSFRKLPR